MKCIHICTIVLAVSGTSMTPSFAAAPPLMIAVQFAPNPPKRGPETITVRLQDAQSRPVNGAIVRISTAMPAMSMTGPTGRAVSRGNGTYVTAMNLTFTTRWYFTITAQFGGKIVKRVVQRDIK